MARPYPNHPNLRGNYAPIGIECDAPDLVIEGEIPQGLLGVFYRNGPDPQYAPRGGYHWFGGDGMVHAFRIENGRVSYRNRWARTLKWQLEHEAGEALFSPFNPMATDPRAQGKDSTLANTNIVWHGGRLLALEEAHAPFAMDPDSLESLGEHSFDGKLVGPMTAHPKIDPESGEMLFFGYRAKGMFTKDMSYHVVDRNGTLTRSEWFEAPFSSMVHDFITTREHVLFPIFPLTGSLERAMKGQPAYAWEPELDTHIGIMPRNGTPADMRWFEGDPCYVFHPMNAWTEGTKVFADVMKFEAAPLFPNADGSPADPAKAQARLVRWTFDLAGNTNGYAETPLDDAVGEFPRLDERRTGLPYRHGVIAANLARAKGDGGVMNSVVWYDHLRGSRSVFTFGPADGISEPVFVPRSPSAAEGDGWLLTVVYRAEEHRSDLAVLDTSDVTAGPIAIAKLPHRVPYGFHGNWRAL